MTDTLYENDVFRTINDKPIFWIDKSEWNHSVESAWAHPGVRLLWTVCEIDVPAGQAFQSVEFVVTCKACLAVLASQ